MRIAAALLCAAALVFPAAAKAELAAVSQTGFVVEAESEVAATPEQAWRALAQVGRWWNGDHTYSGDAANLELDLRAGGCWCERWGETQSVEHMRVVLVMERDGVRTLRAVGGLGPLQEMGASGVLTFTVAAHASGAKIAMTYRVTGDSALGLNELAPLVDMVLMEQFGRLSRFSASASAD